MEVIDKSLARIFHVMNENYLRKNQFMGSHVGNIIEFKLNFDEFLEQENIQKKTYH